MSIFERIPASLKRGNIEIPSLTADYVHAMKYDQRLDNFISNVRKGLTLRVCAHVLNVSETTVAKHLTRMLQSGQLRQEDCKEEKYGLYSIQWEAFHCVVKALEQAKENRIKASMSNLKKRWAVMRQPEQQRVEATPNDTTQTQ